MGHEAYRAVAASTMTIDRKDLVELRHPAPDAGSFLHQVYLHTHIGQIQGNLSARYPAAYDDTLFGVRDFFAHPMSLASSM